MFGVRRFWSNISRPPDENQMGTGRQHSGGLLFKHVEAIHDTNNNCSNSKYQTCGPGAARGKMFFLARGIKSDNSEKIVKYINYIWMWLIDSFLICEVISAYVDYLKEKKGVNHKSIIQKSVKIT